MEDLLRSQIHQNCKLALPEGLKDLMSDISREVLRAQPRDLYRFIANYLGALLDARATLSIACEVCNSVCRCTCVPVEPDLNDELAEISFDDEDLDTAVEVIEKHMKQVLSTNEPSPVKEQSMLLKLLKKTNITEEQVPAVQQAIQRAYKKHCLKYGILKKFGNENNIEPFEAVHHTLQLHKQTKPSVRYEDEDTFVAPDYKPCVTTVSSTSLAGSYIPLPKYHPYSVLDCDMSSTTSEEKNISRNNTDLATSAEIKEKIIDINDKTTDVEETEETHEIDYQNKDIFGVRLSIDDVTEASTSAGLKHNSVEINEEINTEELEEPNKSDDLLDDYSDVEYCDDEVQEISENGESENESRVSSVPDLLTNDNTDTGED